MADDALCGEDCQRSVLMWPTLPVLSYLLVSVSLVQGIPVLKPTVRDGR